MNSSIKNILIALLSFTFVYSCYGDEIMKCESLTNGLIQKEFPLGINKKKAIELLTNIDAEFHEYSKEQLQYLRDKDVNRFSSKLIVTVKSKTAPSSIFSKDELIILGFNEQDMLIDLSCMLAHTGP